MLQALDLMQYDKRVDVVLVNIFGGGVVDMQRLAEGIVVARKLEVCTKPMVVRLRGMFEPEVNQIIQDFIESEMAQSQAPIHLIKDMDLAVLEAVKIAAEKRNLRDQKKSHERLQKIEKDQNMIKSSQQKQLHHQL